MNGQTKTREQILNQDYMSAKDLKILIPTLGINNCRNIINEVVIDMRNDGCYVPPGKTIIALTKYVKKKLGIKERIWKKELNGEMLDIY